MPLSSDETLILRRAGRTPDPVQRQRAVGIVLSKSGPDASRARELLAEGYLNHVKPSFHLIPRGEAMLDEHGFIAAYNDLTSAMSNFTDNSVETLAKTLARAPRTLAPLRMIVGLTHNELAVAMRLVNPTSKTSGSTLKSFERTPKPWVLTARRQKAIDTIAAAIVAVMDRDILQVPPHVSQHFHSKLDKRDTRDGWSSVTADSAGVPYSALLYQRYVGGVWCQVQDAYSEVKGDALLERPLRALFDEYDIPYRHSKSGPSGADEMVRRYRMSPSPDFVVPDVSPTLVIECKVGEDGGTVRDKAARIKAFAQSAYDVGFKAGAVIDGKGWAERVNALVDVIVALVDVIVATQGRTFTLETIDYVLELPEIKALIR